MKERPILFSGEMVRAILEGRKTQTRRVIKHQPDGMDPVYTKDFKRDFGCRSCPYGVPSDRLWVRETHALDVPGCGEQGGVSYQADHDDNGGDGPTRIKWRPSIYMPRWASRVTLEITDVRTERVQDVTNANITAEGMPRSGDGFVSPETPRIWFRNLWDSINEKPGRAWADNPWVWVIEFRRVDP